MRCNFQLKGQQFQPDFELTRLSNTLVNNLSGRYSENHLAMMHMKLVTIT